MSCKCLNITYTVIDGTPQNIEVDANALQFNGYNVWEWTEGLITYTIWHDDADNWYCTTDGVDGIVKVTGIKTTYADCPFNSMPSWLPMGYFELFTTTACNPCECINITLDYADEGLEVFTAIFTSGTYNGYNYFEFGIYTLFFTGTDWKITTDGLGGTFYIAGSLETEFCPTVQFKPQIPGLKSVVITTSDACGCRNLEDRTAKEYKAIKLPVIFQEENRGFFKCCCKFNVLADGSGDTSKNDVNSAWIKLSDITDTATIELYKEGVLSVWQPILKPFIKEPNAFFATVYWSEVLAADGAGCYEIKVNCNIGGVSLSFTWAKYTLRPYTIQNALKTARIRTIFNAYQEIEEIDFTGSEVEDSIRFYGFIGNRQPNTETDNIIYNNRELKSVIRENLNSYEIITDPTCEDHITKLTDLYLLSEQELFISDYNAHNHSYKFADLPAIVKESPEITYFDYARDASLKCIVGDKFNNKRTFYK